MTYRKTILFILFFSTITVPVTLILDPHGDAGYTGRMICSKEPGVPDVYERSIALQIAQAIKKKIECQTARHKIIITRTAGERLLTFQQANFANRLHADLLVHLSFYQDQSIMPHVDLYQFFYEPVLAVPPSYAWISYDQAYMRSYESTKRTVNFFEQFLKKAYQDQFDIERFALPYKPLIGIQVPAFGIEMGVKNGAVWQQYIEPMADALIAWMDQMQ